MDSVFTIQELFADKVLRVPDYQRGYAWESQQLQHFWEDLEYLEKDKDHDTGTRILRKASSTSFHKNLRTNIGKSASTRLRREG